MPPISSCGSAASRRPSGRGDCAGCWSVARRSSGDVRSDPGPGLGNGHAEVPPVRPDHLAAHGSPRVRGAGRGLADSLPMVRHDPAVRRRAMYLPLPRSGRVDLRPGANRPVRAAPDRARRSPVEAETPWARIEGRFPTRITSITPIGNLVALRDLPHPAGPRILGPNSRPASSRSVRAIAAAGRSASWTNKIMIRVHPA